MLQPVFETAKQPIMNMKLIDEVSAELHKQYRPLQEVVF